MKIKTIEKSYEKVMALPKPKKVKPKKLRHNLTFWATLYCIFYKKYHGTSLRQAIANYYVHNTVKFIDQRERDLFISIIKIGIVLPLKQVA